MSKQKAVNIVVVDEAHMVKFWGEGDDKLKIAFRASFAKLAESISLMRVGCEIYLASFNLHAFCQIRGECKNIKSCSYDTRVKHRQ